MSADWNKIKTEYITTNTSYRKLSEKYGIHYKTIADKGKDEGWKDLRSQYTHSTLTKTLDVISNQQVDKLARIEGITDKLLMKLEQAVEELDMEIIKKKVKVDNDDGLEVTTETMEAREGGIVDRAGLRHLTAALKDLKEIQMIKSELDRREQEARIAKLRREAEKEEDSGTEVVITFGSGDAEKWAK